MLWNRSLLLGKGRGPPQGEVQGESEGVPRPHADSPTHTPASRAPGAAGSPDLPSCLFGGRLFLLLPAPPFEARPWALGRGLDPEESVTASSEKDLSRDVSSAESGAVSSSSLSPPLPGPHGAAHSGPSPARSASAWRTPCGAAGPLVSWLEPVAPGGLSPENLRGFRAWVSSSTTGQAPAEGRTPWGSSAVRTSVASMYQEEHLSRGPGLPSSGPSLVG